MKYKSNNQGPTPKRTCDNCWMNREQKCSYIRSKTSLADRKRLCPQLAHSYDDVDVRAKDDRVEIAYAFKIIIN